MLDHWANKTAVIVGASAGLGRVLAEKLAQAAIGSLLLVARDPNRLQETADDLKKLAPSVRIEVCATDVSSMPGAEALGDKLKQLDWSVDLLINAVGQSDRGLLMKLTPPRLEELLKANVYGPLWATQCVAARMPAGSVIVNIGSLASHFAPRYMGGYPIVKHGLRALTEQLRMELAEQQIHVMLVCPGPINRHDTGSRYNHLRESSDLPPEALKSGAGAKIKGLDPDRLALDILNAAAHRKLEIVRPWKARILIAALGISPRLGQWLLKKFV